MSDHTMAQRKLFQSLLIFWYVVKGVALKFGANAAIEWFVPLLFLHEFVLGLPSFSDCFCAP